jgi:hypothetical protein
VVNSFDKIETNLKLISQGNIDGLRTTEELALEERRQKPTHLP